MPCDLIQCGISETNEQRRKEKRQTKKQTLFLNKDFIYLFMREREAETQAEGEAGSMQGARRGLDPGSPKSRPGRKVALNH